MKDDKKGLKVLGGLILAGLAALGISKLAKAGPPAPPPEKPYCCPYCPDCFATLEELQEHVATAHPGERIPIPIDWD